MALHVAPNRGDSRGERAVVLAPVAVEFPDLEIAPADAELNVLDARRRLRSVLDQVLDGEHATGRGALAKAVGVGPRLGERGACARGLDRRPVGEPHLRQTVAEGLTLAVTGDEHVTLHVTEKPWNA